MQASEKSAEQHYLLGAELAQAGDYARAVEEMTRALALAPQQHTARLQLGLLHLTMGQPGKALAVWAPLRELSGGPLPHFAAGLEALIRDDFEHCVQSLEAGIALNTENAPLNHDMGLIIAKVRGVGAGRGQPSTTERTSGASPVRTDFSLYDQTRK